MMCLSIQELIQRVRYHACEFNHEIWLIQCPVYRCVGYQCQVCKGEENEWLMNILCFSKYSLFHNVDIYNTLAALGYALTKRNVTFIRGYSAEIYKKINLTPIKEIISSSNMNCPNTLSDVVLTSGQLKCV